MGFMTAFNSPQLHLIGLLLLAGLAPLGAQSPATDHVGRDDVKLADLEAIDLEGKSFDPATLEGKVTVLDFWASWCSPCMEAFPVLNELRAELAGEGFEIVSVAMYSGPPDIVRQVVARFDLNYPVVLGNDQTPVIYDVLGYPTYLLMDQDGNLVRRYVGDFNNPLARLRMDALALLSDKPLEALP